MLKTNKPKPSQKAQQLIDEFIGIAYDGNSSADEVAIRMAIKCARHVKANCEKQELKVYWLDVIYELKSGYGK